MKQIFEDMVVVMLLLLSVVVNATMIAANLEISSARSFHANAIEEIQASNFDAEVIQEQIAAAEVAGKGDWTLVCEEQTVYADRKDMKVTLHYTLNILPFLENGNEKVLVGYAR